ncbi:MAG: helix-turn-helix transcriptional regulator [Paludibacteraceae bacterium]|nr:helix-turn-helix transcriptional regulator [Paludibacteraceae bacterium]
MDSLGQIIKRRRMELGITQQTLALLAGIGINTLVSIERGKLSVSLSTLMKVLDCLGLEMNLKIKER